MAIYTPAEFIEAVYMAIQRTGEFNRDCEKWKRLPAQSRTTEAQIRAFFLEKYEMWDVNKSLQDVGIAAQAEERMAVLEQQNRDLQAKFVAHSAQAKVYHEFIDHAISDMTDNNGGGGGGCNDNQTMVSQLTHAKSAQTDAVLQAVQTALATANQSSANSGGGSWNGGRGGRHTAGGQGQGQGQGGTRRPASDGPVGSIKTTKYWSKNDGCCWTCGCDISSLHSSANCNCKLPGHIDTHTGDNPAPGASTKDKEFSKWVNVTWP